MTTTSVSVGDHVKAKWKNVGGQLKAAGPRESGGVTSEGKVATVDGNTLVLENGATIHKDWVYEVKGR